MPSSNVGFVVDELDRAQRLFTLMAVLGFILLVVSVVGEYLGWWNELGEVGAVIGTVATGIGIALSVLLNATKRQVRRAAQGIEDNRLELREANRRLETLGGDTGRANEKLDHANEKLDHANQKLDRIDAGVAEANVKHDVTNQALAAIAATLAAHTGLLREIRDRL